MRRRGARGAAATAALVVMAGLLLVRPALAQGREGAFERTLKVAGAAELAISAGSGSIRLVTGTSDTVRIAARLRADGSWFAGADVERRIREIEQHPPIEQQGQVITVGRFADDDLQRNISISYDVTVPERTTITAKTGSGSVDVGAGSGAVTASSGSGSVTVGRATGAVVVSAGSGSLRIGGGTRLDAHTGSGSITASGIAGPVQARSGSGSIRIEVTGKGDVDVSASSGGVTVTGVDGGLRVSSSSGSVNVTGRPSKDWTVSSSSGGVSVTVPPDAAFDLRAHASSGSVESDHPVTMTGRMERTRIEGKVRGGGPLVELRTSSGGIRIH